MAKCPNCGETVSKNDKRCRKCGEKISNGSSNKIIAIIIVIAVIAVIAVFASGILSNTNQVSQSSSDDSSAATTEYWASIKADKFHLPTCEWAEKISEDNKIVYKSREDAIADGMEPCGECNP